MREVFRFLCSIIFFPGFVYLSVFFVFEKNNSDAYEETLRTIGGVHSSAVEFNNCMMFDNTKQLHVAWNQLVPDEWGYRYYTTFYQKIDTKGNIIVEKIKLGRTLDKPYVTIGSLKDGQVYVSWTLGAYSPVFPPLSLLSIDTGGNIIKPTLEIEAWAIGKHRVLVTPDDGVFIIWTILEGNATGGLPLYYSAVSSEWKVIEPLGELMYRDKQVRTSEDFCGMFLTKNKILVCSRTFTGDCWMDDNSRSIRLRDSLDELTYFIVNTEGKLLTKPVNIPIKQYAFRVVEDVYLPNVELIEFNNELILLMTSLKRINNSWKDSIYLLKFSKDGKVILPEKTEYVTAIPVERLPDEIIPKIQQKTLIRERAKNINEFYIYGFDDTGKFYYSRYAYPWE